MHGASQRIGQVWHSVKQEHHPVAGQLKDHGKSLCADQNQQPRFPGAWKAEKDKTDGKGLTYHTAEHIHRA